MTVAGRGRGRLLLPIGAAPLGSVALPCAVMPMLLHAPGCGFHLCCAAQMNKPRRCWRGSWYLILGRALRPRCHGLRLHRPALGAAIQGCHPLKYGHLVPAKTVIDTLTIATVPRLVKPFCSRVRAPSALGHPFRACHRCTHGTHQPAPHPRPGGPPHVPHPCPSDAA